MQHYPRWGTKRDLSRPTRGPLLCRVMELLGTPPHPFQSYMADVALEFHPSTGRYFYPTAGMCIDRQAGKTRWCLGRLGMQLMIPNQLVLYLSYDRSAGRVKWLEHITELLQCANCRSECLPGTRLCTVCKMPPGFATRVRSVIRQNQQECMFMRNGSRYMIATPQGRGGRSLSADLVLLDEALLFQDLAPLGAIQPTLATRPLGQFLVLGSAGTAAAVLFAHFRDLGRAATIGDLEDVELAELAGGMAWFEWSPTDPKCPVADRDSWHQACPSLGLPGGPTLEAFAGAAFALPEEIFRREWLNIWSEEIFTPLVDPADWAACLADDPMQGTPVLALAMNHDRDRIALASSGPTYVVDEQYAVEIVEAGPDIDFVVRRCMEVAVKWSSPVVIDRYSPAGSYIPLLERRGIQVVDYSASESARASGDFHDAIAARRVTHRGDPRLTEALAGATKRKVGQAWRWGPTSAFVDITPLDAASLARWGAAQALIPGVF